MPQRIAIIGAGIAGLGVAHFMHPHGEVIVFEASSHIGGHSNTIEVPGPPDEGRGVAMPVDTGFMVFNHQTYPLLCRLFDELGVETQPADMSFSVQNRPRQLEWAGAGYNQLFGQRRNLFRPSFWRFLFELNRFNQQAPKHLGNPDMDHLSVAQYAKRYRYSQSFLDNYLLPMGGAIWSTAPDRMLGFPAAALIRFFHNHGFLGMDTHFQWYTVTGGARRYVDALTRPFKPQIRINTPVRRVARHESGEGWQVETQAGARYHFDCVVMACHADQALRLLADPPARHRELLGAFGYERNQATVHSDPSVMPRRRHLWSAWNYRLRQDKQTGAPRPSTHYWMNRLQSLPGDTPYFVSLNDEDALGGIPCQYQVSYEHPLYSVEAMAAQQRLPELNHSAATPGLYFVGSYWRYGFHEDAFGSAVWLTRQLLGEAHPWADLPVNPWSET